MILVYSNHRSFSPKSNCDIEIEKNDRAKLLYQKSRILNFLDTYSKDAEDALTKSVTSYIICHSE